MIIKQIKNIKKEYQKIRTPWLLLILDKVFIRFMCEDNKILYARFYKEKLTIKDIIGVDKALKKYERDRIKELKEELKELEKK